MMGNLYKLTSEIEDLLEDETADETAIERVFGEITKSAEKVCQTIRSLDADIAMYKAEEDRLSARRKAVENMQARIKDYLRENMERLDIPSIKAGTFTIRLQDSPPAVDVYEPEAIPPRFYVVIPETKQIDKKAIAAALKNKELIPGACLVQRKHVRIR